MNTPHIIPCFDSGWQSQTWKQQLSNGLQSTTQLLKALNLDVNQFSPGPDASILFKTRVPWSFVARMKPADPHDPLLLQILAQAQEFRQVDGYHQDPLAEQQSTLPILHKYQSRILIVLAGACAINCRYCFRRHFPYPEYIPGKSGFESIMDYLQQHPLVNEVILSGGDPLIVDDNSLQQLLQRLATLPQLTRIRIHSRLPIVIPARVTEQLISIFATSPIKIILVLHANHAHEINREVKQALQPLKQAGVTLLNQSVLLNKINDSADKLAALSEALFDADILPYYLHQLDPVEGAAHFQVSDARARRLYQQLLAILPGFLVPKLVRELTNYPSKLPIDLNLDTI